MQVFFRFKVDEKWFTYRRLPHGLSSGSKSLEMGVKLAQGITNIFLKNWESSASIIAVEQIASKPPVQDDGQDDGCTQLHELDQLINFQIPRQFT